MLKINHWIGLCCAAMLVLTGCGSDATPTPSATPIPPTATLPPLPPTPTEAATVAPTNTPVPAPTTVAKLDCINRVGNARDVNVPDNTVFKPGVAFTKTWRIKNAGTCPWTEGYQLVFAAGDRMEGKQAVAVPPTKAGADVDVTISLIAPFAPGKYKGYWQLRDGTGKQFGTGDASNIAWWIAITVKR